MGDPQGVQVSHPTGRPVGTVDLAQDGGPPVGPGDHQLGHSTGPEPLGIMTAS